MQIFVKKNLKTSFWFTNVLIKFSIIYRALISYLRRFFSSYYSVILDLSFIVLGMLIAIWQRFETFPLEEYVVVIFGYTAVWLVTLILSGSYTGKDRFSLIKPLNGILIGFFVNSAFTYFFNEYAFSRVVVLRTDFQCFFTACCVESYC